jgi:hypothetical protein
MGIFQGKTSINQMAILAVVVWTSRLALSDLLIRTSAKTNRQREGGSIPALVCLL